MANPNYTLIAHELGHAIYGYLYESETRPFKMVFKSDGSIAGCVEFDDWHDLAVVDGNIARIKGNSYLGGMFGELIWYDRVRVMGVRSDIDELLTELRFIGSEGRTRRSRSKLFKELWAWFYTDRDKWSFGGMMKKWMDDPRDSAGKIITATELEKRLPETWKLYEKFLAHIDQDEFRNVVREIGLNKREVLYSRTLVNYAKRIIPDTVLHPEDI